MGLSRIYYNVSGTQSVKNFKLEIICWEPASVAQMARAVRAAVQ